MTSAPPPIADSPRRSRRRHRLVLALLMLLVAGAAAWALPKLMHRYYHHGLRHVVVADGLDTPWALAFLPDGRMLVSERVGRLRIVERDGRVGAPLAGLPPVVAQGEGGLMDVVLDPQFATNRLVYWSYTEASPAGDGRTGTAVARGRLREGGIDGATVIFRDPVKETDHRHYGCRLLFAPDGRLFLTIGDRWVRDAAQDLGSAHGKVLRIEADGTVPADNPFVGQPGALPAVWSFGHRNVQGLAWQPGSGALWAGEHGPQGGDEINLVLPGRNYGWPVVTYGCDYGTCAKIGEGVAKDGMEAPRTWWAPESVPPSGMVFLTSDRYPQWKGQLVVGALHGPAFDRLRIEGDRVVEKEPIWTGPYRRIRDIVQGPDGWLYLVVNLPDGRIVRLEQ